MTNKSAQIVALAKRGWDNEQIAQAVGLQPEDVLLIITQDEEVRKNIDLTNIDEQFKGLQSMAIEGLAQLAAGAENEGVKAKALIYILDGVQGKHKPKQVTVNQQNNYQLIIDRVQKAREKRVEIDISVQQLAIA